MTEEDAKSKWCPFARVASPAVITPSGSTSEQWIGVAGANRGALSERVTVHTDGDASNPTSARCIGSACMAWRRQLSPRFVAAEGGAAVVEGYCGIVGPST